MRESISSAKPVTAIKTKETKPSPPIFDGKGYTGDWLADQEFPELQWAVEGIIPEGLTLLVGAPKAGKSWLSLGIALSVSSGTQALGKINTSEKPVLLLALEDSKRRMQSRCRSILGHNNLPNNLHIFHNVTEDRLISDMKKWVYDHYEPLNPPLVILDTLGKIMSANNNENAYARDYKMGSSLKSVADDYPGTAVVVVHHTRKAEVTDYIDAISGTQGLSGSADSAIILHRPRNEDEGTIKVTGRDVEENEYAIVKGDNGNWQLADNTLQGSAQKAKAQSSRMGENTTRVMDYIYENGPCTTAELTELFGKNVYTWLSRLTEEKRILKIGRGRYDSPDFKIRESSVS